MQYIVLKKLIFHVKYFLNNIKSTIYLRINFLRYFLIFQKSLKLGTFFYIYQSNQYV